MRNIVLHVPSGVFLLFLFSPLILGIIEAQGLIPGWDFAAIRIVSLVLSYMTVSLWYCAVAAYFSEESGKWQESKHVLWWFGIIFVIDFILVFLTHVPIYVSLILALGFIYPMVKLVGLIRTVFYERSVWFIVIELLFAPVGMATLTPTIQRAEKEIREL